MSNTIGSQILDLSQRQIEKMSATEAWKVKERDYLKHLIECAETNSKIFSGDFFIVTQLKLETLLSNALPTFREYFIAQQSCPTPNYDQNVYKFSKEKESITYIWSIPDRETSHYLFQNKDLVHESERQLLDFVLKFENGSLFRLMKQLNGEKHDSPELEK